MTGNERNKGGSPLAGRRVARVAGLAGLAWVAACSPNDPYRAPIFSFAASYSQGPAGAPVLLSNAEWWRGFRDPVLDRLVAQAMDGSIDLAIARERVREAAATRGALSGGGNLGPVSMSLDAASTKRGTEHTGPSGGTEVNLDLEWLLDPWGGRRARLAAGAAREEIAQAEVNAARLAVLSELATAYVNLRYSQRLEALRREDLSIRRKTLQLTQQMFDAGSATKPELSRAQARIAETEALIPVQRAQSSALVNRIAVLIGQMPGSPDLAKALAPAGQPRTRLAPTVGVPADLLRNRPDIHIAERSYYAALGDMKEAEAARWPTLSLGGTITRLAPSNGAGAQYYIGPALEIPELLSSAPKARAAAAASVAKQAHLQWQSTVLGAISDVENALASYSGSSQATGASERAVRLYREALQLTDDMIARGDTTLTARFDAEQSLSDANVAMAGNLRDLSAAFVQLNVVLGSGNAAAIKTAAQ